MSLAGKSGGKKSALEPTQTEERDHRAKTITFSFNEQDGSVGVGRSLHLPHQRFLIFILFFRLNKITE